MPISTVLRAATGFVTPFTVYAVKDHVDLSSFSSNPPAIDVSKINLETLLPSSEDDKVLRENLEVLIGHNLRKIPFFISTIKDWDQLYRRYFCVVFARLLCSAGIHHFRPRPLTLFGNMASLVNLLAGGDKWQNTAT